MPQFSYSAIDGHGRPVQGVLDASTENELIVRLSGQGLRVQTVTRGIVPVASQQTQVPARRPATVSAPAQAVVPPIQTAAPQNLPRQAYNEPRRSDGRPYVAPNRIVRTKRASYKELMFLFAQLGTMLRSGLSPAEAFQRLAGSAVRRHIAEACADIAAMATSGISMAEAMSVYVDIFPEAAVGAVRAGESGGYTHEACSLLSTQYEKSHRMVWHVRFLRWATMIGLSGMPMVQALLTGLDRSFADMSGLAGLGRGFGEAMTGWVGLWFVGLWTLYFVGAWWMRQTRNRQARHRLTMRIPFFAERARKEGLSAFTFHMGRLSQSGFPPNRAWALASSAVPNQALGEAYREVSAGATDGARLGDLVRRSGIFPHDYANVVETGEATGTLPQALEYTSKLADDDRKIADRKSNWALYGTYILFFVVFGIMCGRAFYTGYFDALYKHTVGETEAGP